MKFHRKLGLWYTTYHIFNNCIRLKILILNICYLHSDVNLKLKIWALKIFKIDFPDIKLENISLLGSWAQMVLIGWSAFYLLFLLVSHLLIFLQRKFIYSKPPGRRLVLADVHVLQSRSLAHVITSLAVGGFIASSLGPLSFEMSFLLIEWFKIPLVTYFGISNMSVVLQILTIMDNEWGEPNGLL